MLLRRYLQEYLNFSRRKVYQLIKDGKIFLNRKKIESIKEELQNGDLLSIDGEEKNIDIKNYNSPKQIILFHKPTGYIVSSSDKHNYNIYSILPDKFKKYRYIGRLDKDSSGLLLLSNDLDLVNKLSHPSFNHVKIYNVKTDKDIDKSNIEKLKKGIIDRGEKLLAKDVKLIKSNEIQIILEYGKNRQIRRMLKKCGYEVTYLHRIQHGPYKIGSLQSGQYKVIDLAD